MKRKAGFTLIELLVVISIIALLLSIMMPSLGKVKEMSKCLVCQTNLRQLTLAWYTYTLDNSSRLCGSWNYHPGMAWGTLYDWAWAPWQLEVDYPVLIVGGGLDPACTIQERHEGIKRGVLYEYCENVNAYHCLSDKSAGGNFRSYSTPDSMNGMGWWNGLVFKKIEEVRQPAKKYVFLEENDPRGYNINSWILGSQGTSWGDPLTVWHSGKSNLGFADGHSETHGWSKETSDWFLEIRVYGDSGMTPYTKEGKEDLLWMQEGYGVDD